MTRALLPLLGALALCATGCPEDPVTPEINLYSVTVAPPGRAATLVSDDLQGHEVRMSRGLAFAIGCWNNCKGSCVAPTFEVADPAIAEVRPVYRSAGGYPTWVIVAKSSGTTQLTVADTCAQQAYGLVVADDQ